MSTVKLFGRISSQNLNNGNHVGEAQLMSPESYSYWLTFNPLIKFGSVLAALIHDADHQGVPNSQLVKEEEENELQQLFMLNNYGKVSVAEQHSVNIGWKLFMDSKLLEYVCSTEADALLLRQIVINSVMATDIVDRDLASSRNARWKAAFDNNNSTTDVDATVVATDDEDTQHRKATIVLELLLQASDVSHTMQHWHVYCKWNERLFLEMYTAYLDGRSDCDPSKIWYDGEIGFFEKYIIPLATKLRDSGCYGVSGDEFLSYATSNLEEWKLRGHEVVASMMEKIK
jgi:hypothetical protein